MDVDNGKNRYDLATVPDIPDDESERDAYALARGRYIARVSDLSDRHAMALAYRELGYTAAGIATKLKTRPQTVRNWFDAIAEEYGRRALETRPQSEPNPELE